MNAAPWEQLRRLTNTVMGASHRLSIVARQGGLDSSGARELEQVASELSRAAQRLRRLMDSGQPRP
jgi:hypothetical protein